MLQFDATLIWGILLLFALICFYGEESMILEKIHRWGIKPLGFK